MQEELPDQETPEVEGTDVYDERTYNLWISFNNCTITTLHVEQYGKPVNPPPKGP